MALFNFGKKKEPACSYSANETNGKTISVKVLGSGCKNCRTLLENTKEAVQVSNISAQVEYVTDMQKIMTYGVMSMPALVVNEKVVSMGKVLKPADVAVLLQKQL